VGQGIDETGVTVGAKHAVIVSGVVGFVSVSPVLVHQLEHPIVQAPLAGGASTPALAAAVVEAGGLGFLAAGYKAPDAVRSDIDELRRLTSRPFGVNLFAPPGSAADPDELDRYRTELSAEAKRYGVELGVPRHDDDAYEAKLALVVEERVAVASFAFGCPAREVVESLHDVGAEAWVTVTTPGEAAAATAAGVDTLVVQGMEAGGHRGSFDADEPGDLGLLALLQLVRAATDLPLVATGGIATAHAIAAVLAAGASAAQLGTAFMLTSEAGTSAAHREALTGGASTAITSTFTGRPARGIENRFMREHDDGAPHGYPDVHHMTAPLRAAARERGDPDGFHLWAGQAYELAEQIPAGDLVRRLAQGTREALSAASERYRRST
jgi:nitronate monooxygenase